MRQKYGKIPGEERKATENTGVKFGRRHYFVGERSWRGDMGIFGG